jgi:2-hydroxycyclohexanecarboxyl-CoA dehydrogenase
VDLGIAGQTAVVTGGSSGIGAAVATLLNAELARPVLWDLRPPEPSAPAATLPFLQVDVCDAAAVQNAWDQTVQQFGPVSILVHCAAAGSGAYGFPYTNVPISAWQRVLEVNILGMTHVAHAAGPAMAAQKSGAMVFLASVAGQMGSPTDPPYSASKAANINFAQVMAKDLAPHNVRVNSVCPGMVKTPLNRSVWAAWNQQQQPADQLTYEEWADRKIRHVVPLGRWQQPEDVADLIVFLCSRRASEITGQTINVDGGTVMHW